MDGDKLADSPGSRLLALSAQKRAALRALLVRSASGQYTAIARANRTENIPLSFGQQRLWFLDQLQPGNPAYNLPAIFPLDQPVNTKALRQALEEILRRHGSLRTRFRMVAGNLVQDVLTDIFLEFRIVANAGDSLEEKESVIGAMREEIRRPFDLQRGPLFRAALFLNDKSESVLVITMHHVVADGWSVGLVYQEFKTLYGAFSRGLSSPLEDLPIQYTDFAIWQRAHLGGNSLENQIAYWRRQLAEASALELPTCRPRPRVPTNRGALCSFLVESDLRQGIQALARTERSTKFMVLLAAFMVVLHRYTSQQDITIGCPVAGRSRPETDRLIGFFVNTLAIRVKAGDRLTFLEFLYRVREVVVEALANQDVPFERLVQELQFDRDLGRNPLFQVTFQLFAGPESDNGVAETAPNPTEIDKGTSVFDLAFNLWESSRGIEGRIEFDADIFDEGYANRMACHFVTVLRSIVGNPDQLIGKLALLTEAEKEEILVRWNDTQSTIDRTFCAHELVEQQAQQRPNEYAVAGEHGSLTYLELNRRANSIAHHLQAVGVGLETPVAICIERSPDLIAALLGVMKSGGAYIPIDAASPKQRIATIIRDAGAMVLITSQSLARDLPPITSHVFDIESIKTEARDDNFHKNMARPDSLAYIIYTSGSTGVPKGVEVEHLALLNLMDWTRRTYELNQEDRSAQVASLSFDAAVWEIWPCLAAGARLCIASDDTRTDPDRMLAWLAEQRITVSFLPTPLAESVLLRKLPSDLRLRALLTGGDRLRYRPAQELPFRFNNHYGPTENTVVATFGPVTKDSVGRNPAIGRPISNNQLYILDREMQPVPIGIPGEVCIGGASLARGYRNRPELSADRFVSNPFDPQRITRLFRTGDLGRFQTDGTVEFLGRTDRQIKIRGYRIEPGEIEAVLRRVPGVGDVVITAPKAVAARNRLVAYYVRKPGENLGDLLQYAKECLPEYMIPSAFLELDSIPLTPNGKVDEQGFPNPAPAHALEPGNKPRNAVEEVLAGIWAEVLSIDTVGVRDNFFTDYGGYSLLSVALVSRIREALQIELPVRAIFDTPTIRGLADHLLADASESLRIKTVAELFLRLLNTPGEEIEELPQASRKDVVR